MEKIFEIIYNLSIKQQYLNINDIEKIVEQLVELKCLENYISSITTGGIRSNNVASYSQIDKSIIVHLNSIEKIIESIKDRIKIENSLSKNLYLNMCILQILLHEIEHANQIKIASYNTLESFILRISKMIKYNEKLYEYMPNERFAEIKSYNDIVKIIGCYSKDNELNNMILNDKLQRNMRGYHYINGNIYSPIEIYFSESKRIDLLSSFDWYNKINKADIVNSQYNINDAIFYGFPISSRQYCFFMNELLNGTKKYYKDKLEIVKTLK